VPTPREELSAAMRNARLEAGFETHKALGRALSMARPAISRAESPRTAIPSIAILKAWAKACSVPLEEFTEIVERAKNGVAEWFMPYLGAEQEATRLRFWGPAVVPGLLQTEAYARALEKSDTIVRQRLERQRILGHVAVTAVIDYRVLTNPIGSAEMMAEQCARLIELVESEQIRLHVVPGGQDIGLGGAVAIASKNGHVTLNMAGFTRDITSTEAVLVEETLSAFEALLGAAMAVGPSLEFVKKMEETWKGQLWSGARAPTAPTAESAWRRPATRATSWCATPRTVTAERSASMRQRGSGSPRACKGRCCDRRRTGTSH
jgi:transcriptional regulator with XRE-family HTH domain